MCLLIQIATADGRKKNPMNFNSTNLPPCDRLRKNVTSIKSGVFTQKKWIESSVSETEIKGLPV